MIPIKLIVIDIDGCLIEGEKAPYDFKALAAIRELNRKASPTNTIPQATICSGRPYPYVEAMLKMIDGQLPAIFEHGCGLYFPQRELGRECVYHPAARLEEPQRQQWHNLAERIVQETGAGRQCGKEALVTFFPPNDVTVPVFAEYVASQVCEAGLPLKVGHTASSVDVTPLAVDKGTGLLWLLSELRNEGWNGSLDQVAGIGDSPSDICFLELAAVAAAPANAADPVLEMVDYVSPWPFTRGVLDIMHHVTRRAE
ncbi:MAG: HAD hydrolase family protein [Chloroflexota bacterium]|nr:HAD hydrolase family protein [Chloroflexota bacterium]